MKTYTLDQALSHSPAISPILLECDKAWSNVHIFLKQYFVLLYLLRKSASFSRQSLLYIEFGFYSLFHLQTDDRPTNRHISDKLTNKIECRISNQELKMLIFYSDKGYSILSYKISSFNNYHFPQIWGIFGFSWYYSASFRGESLFMGLNMSNLNILHISLVFDKQTNQ